MMSGFATTAIITLLVGGLGVMSVQKESTALALIYRRHVSGINDLKTAQINNPYYILSERGITWYQLNPDAKATLFWLSKS